MRKNDAILIFTVAVALGMMLAFASVTGQKEELQLELANMRMSRDQKSLALDQAVQLLNTCHEDYALQRTVLNEARTSNNIARDQLEVVARYQVDQNWAVNDAIHRIKLARVAAVAAFNHTTRGSVSRNVEDGEWFLTELGELIKRESELSKVWITNSPNPEHQTALTGLYLIDTALRRLEMFSAQEEE